MSLKLSIRRGCIVLSSPALSELAQKSAALVPAAARASQEARDGAEHHVTLLFKEDVRLASESPLGGSAVLSGASNGKDAFVSILEVVQSQLVNSNASKAIEFADLGLGRTVTSVAKCWFKVLFCPSAFLMRKELGLTKLDFHLTCGFQPSDLTNVDKSASSLISTDPAAGAQVLKVGTSYLKARMLQLRSVGPASEAILPSDECEYLLSALQVGYQSALASATRAEEAGGCDVDAQRLQVQLLCERARVLGCARRAAEAEAIAQQALDLCNMFISSASPSTSASNEFFAAALLQCHSRLVSATLAQPHNKRAVIELCQQAINNLPSDLSSSADATFLSQTLAKLQANSSKAAGASSSSASEEKQPSSVPSASVSVLAEDSEEKSLLSSSSAPADSADDAWASVDPRARIAIETVAINDASQSSTSIKMPRNLSWLIPDCLCGMSLPTRAEQLFALHQSMQVSLLVTLMDEPESAPLKAELFDSVKAPWNQLTVIITPDSNMSAVITDIQNSAQSSDFFNLHIPVPNFQPPNVVQMDLILASMEAYVRQGKRVGVHCGGGKGRAGTILCCFIMKHGLSGSLNESANGTPAISSAEAVQIVRALRPGSVETDAQARFIYDYNKLLWKRSSDANFNLRRIDLSRTVVAPAKAASKTEPASKPVALNPARPPSAKPIPLPKVSQRLFVLCGFPGSGKSTFAQVLLTLNGRSSDTWIRINQDELGHRSACEKMVAANCKNPKAHLIIDRCNIEQKERKLWADLAGFDAKHCIIVYFPTPGDECSRRIVSRGEHPTLGGADIKLASSVVASFQKRLSVPDLKNERASFSAVWVIDSQEELKRRLTDLGVDSMTIDSKFEQMNGNGKPFKPLSASASSFQPSAPARASKVAANQVEPKSKSKSASSSSWSLLASQSDSDNEDDGNDSDEKISSSVVAASSASAITEHSQNQVVDDDFFFKFPRTHHLFDTGGSAVSRDDLLVDDGIMNQFCGPKSQEIVIQEKVDGANLGLSIDSNWQIRAQNRSHFVNSETHSQFGTLNTWIDTHRHELCAILEPNRHILFGEWCRAKHSILYERLTDVFLAFDIYDIQEKAFYSFERVQQILESTSIQMVPFIDKRRVASKDELLSLLETKSQLGAACTFVEGVYLRIDGPQFLKQRAKLVRPDFIQNIDEHWTKQGLIKNTVIY